MGPLSPILAYTPASPRLSHTGLFLCSIAHSWAEGGEWSQSVYGSRGGVVGKSGTVGAFLGEGLWLIGDDAFGAL